jgi:hypothetical protein
MSMFELLDYKIIIACIYRSPDGALHIFIKNMKTGIKKRMIKNEDNNFM